MDHRPPSVKVEKPWGHFEQYTHNLPCTVKIITVAPGGTLSRQYHHMRDELWVVLDEAVVSRPVGGDGVMRAQLERLVEASDLPNVTLQILPFEAGGHAGMDGTFAILDFPEPSDPDVVYAENATGGLFLEKSDELRKYTFIFDHIRAAALGPEESVAYIAKLAKEPLWKSRQRGSMWT